MKIEESDANLTMLMRVWLCSLFDTFSVVNVSTGQVWKSVLDQLFPALELLRVAAQGAPRTKPSRFADTLTLQTESLSLRSK